MITIVDPRFSFPKFGVKGDTSETLGVLWARSRHISASSAPSAAPRCQFRVAHSQTQIAGSNVLPTYSSHSIRSAVHNAPYHRLTSPMGRHSCVEVIPAVPNAHKL